MNWQQWSETQAQQILELRRRLQVLRWRLTDSEKRARMWRQRALDKDRRR